VGGRPTLEMVQPPNSHPRNPLALSGKVWLLKVSFIKFLAISMTLLSGCQEMEKQMIPVVPETWKPRLRQYLRERHGENHEHLSAGDFPNGQSVLIRFPDGSHVLFRFAFAIADEAAGEVAVFTEHCGYHVFPAGEAEVEILRSIWPDAGA
jgi:hypothetical protein